MLGIIGEQPVNLLNLSSVSEATIAQGTLTRMSRLVQAEGLNCNTDEDVTYLPDSEGYIALPSNILQVDASDSNRRVSQRGLKLYDKEAHSFVFTKSIDLDTIIMLDFDDLPQTVKDYVAILAARRFAADVLGSDVVQGLSDEIQNEAKRIMNAAEVDKGDYSIFDTPDCIQAVLNRGRNATNK